MQSPILSSFDEQLFSYFDPNEEFECLFDEEIGDVCKAQDFIDTCPEATSKELLLISPQSLLRRSLLTKRGEEWVKYCLEHQVCVDCIYSFCSKGVDCPSIHLIGFGKEELFFRTARCWKGSLCENRSTTCRFWHDILDGEKRVAQQNIAEALIFQGKARCLCQNKKRSFCLKCTWNSGNI
eukprot:c4696_g1_i1.p1 GENE.c4696_g1_i1~~c4696_g1_i1.p1  ORF type:complete len:196 (+),score=57.17 c4696_g1_i1:47-589(+)